jgi:selenocysteine lyase/cysteine desulfurase
MNFKSLFSQALAAAPDRLHLAAHSHHLWPDATRLAQIEAWDDAARLADLKWDKVMGQVLPDAQRYVAEELGLPSPATVVFASNTHDHLIKLVSAMGKPHIRVLATDAEFHSFRRQTLRWLESGRITLELIAQEPFESLGERFLARAAAGQHDLIFVSQVFFNTGRIFAGIEALAALSDPAGPWVVIDGYHGFCAIGTNLGPVAERLFYLGGGYKYAMAGEGAAFLHAPPGFGPRPEITGWYAELSQLEEAARGVAYPATAQRFAGATFDPSGLYRLNAAFAALREAGQTTATISDHVSKLQADLLDHVARGEAGKLAEAELLNPLDGAPHARFLALRDRRAASWKRALGEKGVVVDVRDDVMRIGLALYHDAEDVARFARICQALL